MGYELWVIGAGIIFGLIGFIIGIILVCRSQKESPSISHYKQVIDLLTLRRLHHKLYSTAIKTKEPIKHYEGMRDKLTLRKEVPEEESGGRGFNIANLIGGFIVILIGGALFPEIARQVKSASVSMNASTSMFNSLSSIIEIVPVFFVLTIAIVVISIIFNSLRDAGLI